MNPREQEILENLLDQLVRARGIKKVPEADAMIRRAVEQQPDAVYLLAQKSLILEQALKQANARIADLEQGEQSSFLGTGVSSVSAPEIQRPAPPERPQAGYSGPSAQLPSSPPQGPPMSPAGGTGSFLGQAAATAAGVAGGAFLFEGLEHMLSPHGSFAQSHDPQSFIPENVTVNNYYDGKERPIQTDDDERPDRFADADPENEDNDDDSRSIDDDDEEFI
jgi:uncharacterized protein